jgi:hypothetical protein
MFLCILVHPFESHMSMVDVPRYVIMSIRTPNKNDSIHTLYLHLTFEECIALFLVFHRDPLNKLRSLCQITFQILTFQMKLCP